MTLLNLLKHLPGKHNQKLHGRGGSADRVPSTTNSKPGYWRNPPDWKSYTKMVGTKDWIHGLYDMKTGDLILPGRAGISNAYHWPLIQQYSANTGQDPNGLEERSVRFSAKFENDKPTFMFFIDRAGLTGFDARIGNEEKALKNINRAMDHG